MTKQNRATISTCPCCGRVFDSIFDYPLVLVKSVKILPIPEAIDSWSNDAVERARLEGGHGQPAINVTPDIANACESLRGYFQELVRRKGETIRPAALAPQLIKDPVFRQTYQIPQSSLRVGFHEAPRPRIGRLCQVTLLGAGPNLGSMGGPTLQPFGPIAAIRYEGLLESSTR